MKVNKEWISISDMMAGLMMVFLFIAVSLMMIVQEEQNTIKKIVFTYSEYQDSLKYDLQEEFKEDLMKWDAEILSDNTIRFKSPDVLFKINESSITTEFRTILNDFFPRYISLLTNDKYKNEIDEIRVEGHTSSIWNKYTKEEDKYLNNMVLSQNRAKSVLAYCYKLSKENQKWLNGVFRANGLSYSKNILDKEGKEDIKKSQRVEFKVITKAEEKIFNIIETLK